MEALNHMIAKSVNPYGFWAKTTKSADFGQKSVDLDRFWADLESESAKTTKSAQNPWIFN